MSVPSTLPSRPQTITIIWLICQFELVRVALTKRGLMLVIAFAISWLLLLKYPIYQAAAILSNPNYFNDFFLFSQTINLEYLLAWPYPELAIYWLIAAFVFPLTSVLFASDQLASDHNRGTLRFIALRASRNQLLFGRFLAQLIIVFSGIVLTLGATMLMALIRDPSSLLAATNQLVLIGANLFVLCLPFIALMSLFNCIFVSARLSVMATVIVIPLLSSLISLAALGSPGLSSLLIILPGQQLTSLVQADAMSSLNSAIVPLAQTVCYLVLAQQIFARRAL